jgi:hypothetical protein
MTHKWLVYYEAQYLRALDTATVLGCRLDLIHCCAVWNLDAEEYEWLRHYLEIRGIATQWPVEVAA